MKKKTLIILIAAVLLAVLLPQMVLAVADGTTMTVEATGYSGTYDGLAHDGVTNVIPSESGAAITYSTDGETYGDAIPQFTGAGTYTVWVKATKEDFDDAITTVTAEVSKASLTVAADDMAITYGDAAPASYTYQITGFADDDSGSVVSGEPSLACSYSQGDDAGGYDITIDVSGMSAMNYTFTPQDGTLTVNGLEMTVYASGYYGTYDGLAHDGVTNITKSQSDATITFSTYGQPFSADMPQFTNVDTYTVYIKASKKNYKDATDSVTVFIEKKDAEIFVRDSQKIYGEDDPEFEADAYGTVDGEELRYSILRNEGKNVGTYHMYANYDEDFNGNYDITVYSGTFTIDEATLTVTANDETITYGDAAPASYTYQITGFAYDEDGKVVSGEPSLACSYSQGGDAGGYDITVDVSGMTAANYKFAPQSGTLTVSGLDMTVDAAGYCGTYDGVAHVGVISVTPSESSVDITYSTDGAEYSAAMPQFTGAGTYTVYVKASKKNYKDATYSVTVTINKASLTVAAEDKTVTYGDKAPEYSCVITGFAGSDTAAVLRGGPLLACGYSAGNGAGTYGITSALGTLASDDYTFLFADGTLTVDKAALKVTADNDTIVFLDAAPGYTASCSGFVAGDDKSDLSGSLLIACSYAQGDPAGTYPVKAGGYVSGNYDITYVDGTLTVEELILTVEFVDYNGAPLDTQAVVWGNAVSTADPVREGNTFTGWSLAGDDDTYPDSLSEVKENIVATAAYTINTYTVMFFERDGATQIGNAQTIDWEKAAVFETAPAITGYAFDKWSLTGDNDTVPDSLTHVKENITAVASYIRNGYTVTFVDYNGTVLGTDGVLYGDAAVAPEDPQREGYTFIGWDVLFNNIIGSITVTAEYEINTYTVEFVDHDGTVIDTQTVGWNTAAEAPRDPQREGYTFTGWDKDLSAVIQDLTVTAQYEAVDVSDTGKDSPDAKPTPQIEKVVITIVVGDLPEGTASVKLPSGEVIELDGSDTLQIEVDEGDIGEDGSVEVIPLDEEGIPLGTYTADTKGKAVPDTEDAGSSIGPVLMWVVIGIAGVGALGLAAYLILRKRLGI